MPARRRAATSHSRGDTSRPVDSPRRSLGRGADCARAEMGKVVLSRPRPRDDGSPRRPGRLLRLVVASGRRSPSRPYFARRPRPFLSSPFLNTSFMLVEFAVERRRPASPTRLPHVFDNALALAAYTPLPRRRPRPRTTPVLVRRAIRLVAGFIGTSSLLESSGDPSRATPPRRRRRCRWARAVEVARAAAASRAGAATAGR